MEPWDEGDPKGELEALGHQDLPGASKEALRVFEENGPVRQLARPFFYN